MSALTLPLWAEWLVAALLVVGAAFVLIGSWALVKFSDFFKRLHGPSKASTLGVGCVLMASALVAAVSRTLDAAESRVLKVSVLIILFFLRILPQIHSFYCFFCHLLYKINCFN